MHPAEAIAAVIVDEWIRCGGREAVLCPGSRSAPLAYALHEAELTGRIRLHVRVDERSAAFLALGLGKVSRRPALLVTTSGTAVANLHPAVLEAHHAAVPLLVCTADRPATLRGTGANQTTDQPGIFGAHLRLSVDLPAPHRGAGQVAAWRSTVSRGWAAATGGPSRPGWPGPVHLNVGLDDPLAPDPNPAPWPEPLDGRADGAPWVELAGPPEHLDAWHGAADPRRSGGAEEPPPTKTLVIVGDLPDPAAARRAVRDAAAAGYPVVTEPFGRPGAGAGVVMPHGPSVLDAGALWDRDPPERIVVVGRVTLTRQVGAALRSHVGPIEAVTATPYWADPGHRADRVYPLTALPALLAAPADRAWAGRWVNAARSVAAAMAPALRATSEGAAQRGRQQLTGPLVAQAVLGSLTGDDIVMLGSSNTVRDVDLAIGYGLDPLPAIVANRGLAGIDGTVATAAGIALSAGRRVTALLGDLTFLHDLNALLIGPAEVRPDLDIVVVNDDGGGIFETLEYGEPARLDAAGAAQFDRIFATPTGADLAQLCSGLGVTHYGADTETELTELLQQRPASGVRMIEIRLGRGRHRRGRERLRSVVQALGTEPG